MTRKIRCLAGFFLGVELILEFKIKIFVRQLWLQCRDWKTLVLFILWWLICGSPTWVGYTMYFITNNIWHLTYANACIAFWAGPFTPEIPLCIVLAVGTRRILRKLFKG